MESGYSSCRCRDCFEIAISNPDFCWECEEAGCGDDEECSCDDAYRG